MKIQRREFLLAGTAAGSGLAAAMIPGRAFSADEPQKNEMNSEGDVSPAEDLMREHGLLERILLIYGDCVQRLQADQDLPVKALAEAAAIVRTFVEDYHEKLEEDFLFPRFKKANKLVDLVNVLLDQHNAGRRLTDAILRLTTESSLKNAEKRKELTQKLQWFIRMYNPHAAREDTVLFPALHSIVTAHEYDRLGDDFEKKEQQLFGAGGFEKMVDRVASIEKTLGLYELGQFTPQM